MTHSIAIAALMLAGLWALETALLLIGFRASVRAEAARPRRPVQGG